MDEKLFNRNRGPWTKLK